MGGGGLLGSGLMPGCWLGIGAGHAWLAPRAVVRTLREAQLRVNLWCGSTLIVFFFFPISSLLFHPLCGFLPSPRARLRVRVFFWFWLSVYLQLS